MRIIVIDDFPHTDFICPITDENGNTRVFNSLADAKKEADELQNGKLFNLEDPLNSIQKEKIKARIQSIKNIIDIKTTTILTTREVNKVYDNLDSIINELD